MRMSWLSLAMLTALTVSARGANMIADPQNLVDGELWDMTTEIPNVPFAIYLPVGYTGGTETYPVIYHLHGINGQLPDSRETYKGPQVTIVPNRHETAVENGWIEKCIIVFPDGYADSFWADSYDGAQPAESDLMVRLIPYIDSHYRTRNPGTRNYRAMQGFSMGGFGAAKFAAKFPDQFCCSLMYDGALLQWDKPGTGEDIVGRHPDQVIDIFNSSETYFNQYSPYYWVDQNHVTLAALMPFRQVVAKLDTPNIDFEAKLAQYAIPHEYPGYPEGTVDQHTLPVAMDYDSQASWTFISDSFVQGGGDTTPPGNVTNFSATAGDQQVDLTWTNPGDADLAGIKIQRSTTTFPATPNDGTNVYNSSGTSHTDSNLTNGTTYYYSAFAYDEVPNFASGVGVGATPQGSGQQLTFNSVGAEDGWALESTESSGVGGSIQAGWLGASGLEVGDNNQDKQFKGLLSFDTSSLPDGATIVSATVRLKRGTVSGTNPFSTHGTCYVDVRNGGFNNNTALETADFQAAATASQAATLSNAPANGDWSEGVFNAAGRSAINKTGKTQVRVYFSLDDNDDMGNDYIGYYPGDNQTPANRPELIVVFEE